MKASQTRSTTLMQTANRLTPRAPASLRIAADPTDKAQLVAAYILALKAGTVGVLGAAKEATLVPIEYNGDFNWDWTTGNVDINKLTYDYISGAVSPSTDIPGACAVGGTGSLPNLYGELVKALTWQFNPADEAALQAALTKSSVQEQSIVATYTGIYGPITHAQLLTAQQVSASIQKPIDYILTYQAGYLWAGVPSNTAPISLISMQNTPNLRELLQYAPPSAEPVIQAISEYVNALGPSASLMDAQSFGSSLLANLKKNLTPSATNGGILQSNPPSAQQYFPAFSSNMQPGDILAGLQNSSQTAYVNFTASSAEQGGYNVSFSGGGSMSWGGMLLGISVGANFQGDVAAQQGSGSTFDIEMSFPGVTAIPFAPASYQINSDGNTGWLDETVLYQALNNYNNGSKDTGFTFQSGLPSGIKLGPGGVGYLSTVVVSAYPTIKITFAEGDYSTWMQWLSAHASVSVDLFGFISLGGANAGAFSAQVQQNTSSSGFSLTLTPPPVVSSTSAPNQGVPVLAGQVSWLGSSEA
ncbi:hypothetical protein HI113_25690 [Corallococcus exiguus]|uniref:hypothetical protein n=1 Tax=Corallococcus exiguus TaxID=83462 RepID=UPI0014745C98|nr:hypothetical protein [Corallococcus exiguus]NNB97300.1 hypothetical protein [Corallococcus exiguus]